MVERQRQRLEQEMTKLVDDVDKQFLRKMQADMHRCAAKCCDNMEISLDSVQSCVSRCNEPLDRAQNYVHQEITHLQNRLQRCVMECNDEAKDKIGHNPSQGEVDKYTLQFDNCCMKCVDKHIELMPGIMRAIKTVLSKQNPST